MSHDSRWWGGLMRLLESLCALTKLAQKLLELLRLLWGLLS